MPDIKDTKTTVTLKFESVPSVAFAMAGVEGWVAKLGGYSWLITLGADKENPEKKTYVAAYRSNFRAQAGVSSNPITVIAKDLETFEEAAEACYEQFMKVTASH